MGDDLFNKYLITEYDEPCSVVRVREEEMGKFFKECAFYRE